MAPVSDPAEDESGATATAGGATSHACFEHQVCEYQELLEELRRWRAPTGQRLRLRISEVAFFYHGSMCAWYFSSAQDGSLRRKNRAKVNTLGEGEATLVRGGASALQP